MSRNAVAAAQYYTWSYYKQEEYEQATAKLTLAAMLVLGSKQADYKALYTSHIAYIIELDPQ